MKAVILVYALTGLATLVPESIARSRALRIAQDEQEPPARLSTTKKYIVEVEPGFSVADVGHKLHEAPRKGNYYKEFDCHDIFSGIVIESDTENTDTLRTLEGVVNVWPMRTVPIVRPPPIEEVEPEQIPRNWSVHRWTGVDKLHAAGIRGKGVKVAIVDTGIDYTHKALGGCFGPGCKVVGGYDLVGMDWDPYNERDYPKIPDDDPLDYYGHGTHVAGIIAADTPDAELLIYKVFADQPWDSDEETLIQAFCDAYGAGADVISASIGRPEGFVDNPWALVASRLVDKGVVVVISAGNEGHAGPFATSTGSNGDGVISVASINVTGKADVDIRDPEARPIASQFTTWGPTNELLLKPDIGAPGYRIWSTVTNQSYETMSGTSMSAPYIAGIAALYIGEHGGRAIHGPGFGRLLWERITSSGKNVAWSAAEVLLNRTAPPFQVGTGLVDAWKVLNYDTHLSSRSFALQDTERFQSRWTANITNTGNETLNYTFRLDPIAGANMYSRYSRIAAIYQLEPYRIIPNVTLPEPLVLDPGDSKVVEFEFGLPDVDDDYLPLYGGKVWVEAHNGERLSIALYAGAAYDTEKAFDTMFNGEPYISPGPNYVEWVWSFNMEEDSRNYAALSLRLTYPCTHLRWDIYRAGWTNTFWEYPPMLGEHDYVGSATTYRHSDVNYFFDPDTMDKNDTISFPLTRVRRSYQRYWWFGKLANGTQIRPGNYSMRVAALRPYGNPEIADHWDVVRWDQDTFEVLPYNATWNSTESFRWKRGHGGH
ncbi:hypothetical protein S40293_02676 [Stachybotrys chartarum IBT 40293]|nr:hypothetical protein S40293_02676 [Stachybotrys chartarum IBT 40293]